MSEKSVSEQDANKMDCLRTDCPQFNNCPFSLDREKCENESNPCAPWTDPISGEVDFEEMANDLGFDDGCDEEMDYY